MTHALFWCPGTKLVVLPSYACNYDAAYGNILGSCVFNFIILAFADALSFNCGPLYQVDQSSFLLIVGGAFIMLIFLPTLILSVKLKVKTSIKYRLLFGIVAVLIVGTYLAFLVLSNIDLHLNFAPF